MNEAEYEAAIKDAERALKQAQTADDVRSVWRKHTGSLGHRTLGRLLLGQSADRLLDRRAEREA
ncbi:MAG TPA: hypothetical protein VI876_12165 [Dehalococcoidia bacterium]|nr:hypothetical protein [Dehalococcoidia bacterium]